MTGGHNLNAAALGLALDQIDQEAESRRVNPIFQLLDKVERGRSRAEQCSEDSDKPKRAIRSTQGRNVPSVLLLQSQKDSTSHVLIEKKVIHVHGLELADPLQENFLPGRIRAGGGQDGGQVLALITKYRLTGLGWNPHLGG